MAHLDKSRFADEEAARREIESAGKVPILATILFFVQTHLFCVPYATIVRVAYGAFIMEEMTVYGFTSVAIGYLGLSAIYVIGDVILSRALSAQHITLSAKARLKNRARAFTLS